MNRSSNKTPGHLLEEILGPLSEGERKNQTLNLYLRQLVKTLPMRYEAVIRHRYGLYDLGTPPKTHLQIAKELRGLFKKAGSAAKRKKRGLSERSMPIATKEGIRYYEKKGLRLLRLSAVAVKQDSRKAMEQRKVIRAELTEHLSLLRLIASNEDFFKGLEG